MRPRPTFHRTKLALLIGVLPLAQACLLFSPLDEVSDGEVDDDYDDVGGPANGGRSSGGSGAGSNGGTASSGSGGSSSPGTGGNLETGNGGNLGLSGSGGSSGMGGTSAPLDVASWCPDPVALFAQNNPYIASFTLMTSDCPGTGILLEDVPYNAGVGAAENCTLMTARISSEVCGYYEFEFCTDVMIDATVTADLEAESSIVQLEPGGPIAGSTDVWFTFYELGEFALECSGTYAVTYTPQFAQ